VRYLLDGSGGHDVEALRTSVYVFWMLGGVAQAGHRGVPIV